MRILLAVCIVSLVTASPLSARDIYVNNVGGDDHQLGNAPTSSSEESGPTRTIRRALKLARFGDRVILENTGQPYRECISLEGPENSGSKMTPFVLEGNGAILDGSLPVPTAAWQPVAGDVLAFQPPRTSFCLLLLDGELTGRQSGIDRRDYSLLKPREWTLTERQILFRVEQNALPSDYELSYTALPVGVTLYGVRNVVIRNLFVQGYRIDGINAHDNAFEVALEDLTCRANGRSGISVGGASRVAVRRSVLRDNGTTQLRTEGWSHTRVVQSELVEGGQAAWIMDGGQLIIDGKESRRATSRKIVDRAPLHRP